MLKYLSSIVAMANDPSTLASLCVTNHEASFQKKGGQLGRMSVAATPTCKESACRTQRERI